MDKGWKLSSLLSCSLHVQETVDYLSRPENYEQDGIIPGLDNYDFTKYFLTSSIVFLGLITTQLFHEGGHKVAKSVMEVKTGPSFWIPNFQLGLFGSITQIREPVRDRTELWNFAFAGLAAGGLGSLGLFLWGLGAAQVGN